MKNKNSVSRKRKFLYISIDSAAFLAAFLVSYQIHSDIIRISIFSFNALFLFLFFFVIKISVFEYLRLYNISLDFISLHELANTGKAAIISSGIIFIIINSIDISFFLMIPRGFVFTDLLATFLLSSGFKISRRMYFEVVMKSVGKNSLPRALIIGAGNTGEQLIRAINRNPSKSFFPVGFIDDNPSKKNLFVQGIEVLGTTNEIISIVKSQKIDTIIIAILSAERSFHKRILKIAKDSGVSNIKVVSTINDLSNHIQVTAQDIKDIDVCDLIGRHAVSVDTREISGYLNGKRVLITGAAGSIGSELSKQVCFYNPEAIGILDINESDLATLEVELNSSFAGIPVQSYLCDISDNEKVDRIFGEFRPEVIFHAAAFKHVPVMERFPEEAVRVNIIGTYHLAKAALKYKIKHFILISTDKAVNPTSVMGVTKRIAEIIVTGAGINSGSQFVAVRFGNVLGSRGSVLPIFLEQIKKGGPLTVTHPEMKRYFMTIPEAVALVLQAAVSGKSSDIFILDMGEPVKIIDLARELILLNNLEPEKDIKIVFTGIREGEKLFEEILTAEEQVDSTQYSKIFKTRQPDDFKFRIEEIASDFYDYRVRDKEEWIKLFGKYVPSYYIYENQNLFYIHQHFRINRNI